MIKKVFVELQAVFHLALPLILNLLAYMAMQFVDTLMLGKLGASALAAAALGGIIFIIILVGSLGITTAVGTLAAKAFGEKNFQEAKTVGQQSIWLCLIISLPAMYLIWNAHHFLFAIKQPTLVVYGAKDFLHGLFWGFFPDLCFIALREYAVAISKPRIVMYIAIAAIPVNALLNYWLMFGGLGVPAMHIFGVGLATSIVNWLMVIVLALYITLHPSTYRFPVFRMTAPRFSLIKKIFSLGFPVGISFIVEESLFMVTALLIGYFGVVSLAAHQIAIQCMLGFVMVPIGISQAAAVRVSQLQGASRPREAFIAAYIAVGAGILIAFLAACCLWLFPYFLVHLFLQTSSENQAVIQLAIKLLAIIAVFHIIDAGQIIINGALRGYQDTFVPMLLGVLSFWLAGIGSGYVFGFVYHFGVIGLWWGLALGVTVSAVVLQFRLLKHKPRNFLLVK